MKTIEALNEKWIKCNKFLVPTFDMIICFLNTYIMTKKIINLFCQLLGKENEKLRVVCANGTTATVEPSQIFFDSIFKCVIKINIITSYFDVFYLRSYWLAFKQIFSTLDIQYL